MAKSGDPNSERCTVWAPFPADTDYFVPSNKPFMVNLQVENLDEAPVQLKTEGFDVNPKVESCDYGKFGWITDPKETESTLGAEVFLICHSERSRGISSSRLLTTNAEMFAIM